MRSLPLPALGLLAACAAAAPAAAQTDNSGHPSVHPPPGGPVWHGDIRHFPDHDLHVWRGGHWVHGPHRGRAGWWWVVGPTWYFYPAPAYPWPNPYEPPPPWTVPVPPPTQYWYFCEASGRYYPYVATCASGWQARPAEQAPSPAASAASSAIQ